MARVPLENLTNRFNDVIAVRDFTLEIADGEFLVLVGPSDGMHFFDPETGEAIR